MDRIVKAAAGGARRLGLAWAAAAAAVLMAACGGGDPVQRYVPLRLVAFGDEQSVIDDSAAAGNGRQYTVNAVDATSGALTCAARPIWVFYMIQQLGLVVAKCNPDAKPVTAFLDAVVGAKAADLQAQIDARQAGSAPVVSGDLVSVYVGANDVAEQYATFSGTYTRDGDQACGGGLAAVAQKDELRARGAAVAAQVNRLTTFGAKVLAVTAPDWRRAPFGLAEEAANPGRSALLADLACEFNRGLRLNIEQDGRKIGLVQADDVTLLLTDPSQDSRWPRAYGLANWTQAACAVALPDCTTATLVSGASADTWLWASDRHMGTLGQRQLGGVATFRVRNNPF